ncbi:MAG: DUF47 family protein [Candidatus Zixiibacteriota bacterium]|jgi:uncharacterized protein Yka (UPF0111/DUF47 family)
MSTTEERRGLLKRVRSIRILPPKDSRFYNYFDELSGHLVEASEDLVKLFQAALNERDHLEEKIHSAFVRCSRISELIEELLHISQQPPFERTEIMELTRNLVRIIKYIKHAANRYVIYSFPTSDKEMRELAPVINSACVEIAAAIKQLPRNRNLDSYLNAINRYEVHADNIYHNGLKRRFAEIRQNRIDSEKMIEDFRSRDDAKSSHADLLNIDFSNVQYTRHVAIFFILREVYVELEKASDACTDVASSLKRMVAGNV